MRNSGVIAAVFLFEEKIRITCATSYKEHFGNLINNISVESPLMEESVLLKHSSLSTGDIRCDFCQTARLLNKNKTTS